MWGSQQPIDAFMAYNCLAFRLVTQKLLGNMQRIFCAYSLLLWVSPVRLRRKSISSLHLWILLPQFTGSSANYQFAGHDPLDNVRNH